MLNIIKKSDNGIKFNKIDGVLAIFMGVYIIFCMFIYRYMLFDLKLLNRFAIYFSNGSLAKFLFYIPLSLFQLFPIFIILKYRKQSLKSIGFNKEKILKQIGVGIVFYLPICLVTLISNWKLGVKINLNLLSIWNFLYMLIEIALVEEIIFRGFIQQRLKGVIENKYINLIVVAIIFGSYHIPFILYQNNITFIEAFLSTIPKMIIHVYLVAVYKVGNNSVTSTSVLHGINNLISSLY